MACSCNTTYGNTGTPGCENIMEVARKLIVVPLYSNTGVRNSIDLSATLNDAYFTGKINHVDPTQRWYPLPLIENVEDTKNDPIVESFNSGKSVIVQDGTRIFSAIMPKQAQQLIGKLKQFGCKEFGIFVGDKSGNLIGEISADGTKLYPSIIDQNTLDVRLVKSGDTTVQKIMLKFEFSELAKDEDLRIITPSEMDNVDILYLEGIIDVTGVVTGITTTTFNVDLSTIFGTAKTKIKPQGWIADNFVLHNETDNADVTVTVDETSAGVYDLTYAAQTAGDIMTLNSDKDGYELAELTITIPGS